MKNLTLKNKLYLKFLAFCDREQRKAIIRTSHDDQLKLLVEIIYNLLKGVISLSRNKTQLLTLDKNNIRKVVADSVSMNLRRKRLLKIVNNIPIIIQLYFKYEPGINLSSKEKI